MDNNFPKIKENSTQKHGVQRSQREINKKKSTTRQITLKFLKTKDKNNIMKGAKGEKINILHKGKNAMNKSTLFIINKDKIK